MHQMPEKDLETMTFYEFKKLTLKTEEHPNLSQSDIWDNMMKRNIVRPALIKGKTSKNQPGAVIPRFTFKQTFASLCPALPDGDVRMKFEEEHDVGLVKQYATACGARAGNAENLKAYYESRLPPSKKGRQSLQQEKDLTTNQSLIQSIMDHEARIVAMLTPRRRLKHKRSVEEANRPEADAEAVLSSKTMKQVEYSYSTKQKYSVPARRYGEAGGAQSMSHRLQVHAVGSHTVVLVIHNCCLTLVFQIIQRTSPEPSLPIDLLTLFDQIANKRSEIIASIGLEHVEGKDIINTIFNGDSPPNQLKEKEPIKMLQKIALYVRWVACSLLHDDYMSLKDNKNKNFPSATIMSLMWRPSRIGFCMVGRSMCCLDRPSICHCISTVCGCHAMLSRTSMNTSRHIRQLSRTKPHSISESSPKSAATSCN